MAKSRPPRAEAQQRRRRRQSLFRMAAKYSIDFQSDIFVIMRIKRDGQIYSFNSAPTEQWPPSMSELVHLTL